MTRIAGYILYATPCCGAEYCGFNYLSMNFTARGGYWTDGWRDVSLMPNGEGLRRCSCGNFYLLQELRVISRTETADAPLTQEVDGEDLPLAIAHARTPAIECAARLQFWRHLSHPYRESYRTHRDAEDAAVVAVAEAAKAQWEACYPDKRNWWQRLTNVPPPIYQADKNKTRAITFPAFRVSDVQRDNMNALLQLAKKQGNGLIDLVIQAELHRQLGQFDAAQQALKDMRMASPNAICRVIGELARKKELGLRLYAG